MNLSEICEEAIRAWLLSEGGVREEWLTRRLPDDWSEEIVAIERKREQQGKGAKRSKKLKDIPADVPAGFRTSEGDAMAV